MFNQTLAEIAEHYKVSERMVRRWVDTGMLKYGQEYIDMRLTNGRQSKLRFSREALDKVFLIPPEKR